MSLNGSSITRVTSRILMLPCRNPVCKADSLPIWRVPSNRLSGYSTWRRTVLTRRRRHLPEGCNAKGRRNAALAEYHNYEFINIKISSLCNRKMI